MGNTKKTSRKSVRRGKLLGSIFWHIRFRRKIILKNLNIAFPNKNLQWKKTIGKKCFQSIGSVLFEFFRLPVYFRDDKLDNILVVDKGQDLLEKYKDTGAILITCHLGNWELAGARISAWGHKLTALAYRQKSNIVHKYMHKIRSSYKMNVVYHRDSMRPFLATLKRREFIGFLADQNTTPEKGIFVNFFGKQAIVVDLPAKLSVKMKRSILFFCACYDEKDHMYHMELEELKSDQELNEKGDVEKIVRMYTDRIEEAIRQHPEQYLWFHKRWKTRPDSESNIY
ncbi:MAG: lipid A biosynthesis acyltransferase [Acidobacteria bacterium CG_4_9_14_3_um_filter_49_7]|nr:MAG: lipid A biosynthesis acyltransferase [Acidobacteria bacterium CG_4_9_14_3_um_filter_49_7]